MSVNTKYKAPKLTKKDFGNLFSTEDICLHKIFNLKYKNTTNCEKCNKTFKYHKLKDKKLYSCQWCGYNIAPTANTIFHKSSTSLKDWFYAIYLFSVSKNGVSAKELERQLGVTYKCAYRIAQRIRNLFNGDVNILNSIVEIDETYIGGKEGNKHFNKRTSNTQGRSTKVKTPVIGAVQRKGSIVAKVVNNTNESTVKKFVRENVSINANLQTDEYRSYNNLQKMGYKHNRVNHGIKQYVSNDNYTNTIEGFWSQLKRSINGTYHFVSPKYLQQYVNEFCFRYNHRKSNQHIFNSLIQKVGLPFQG